MSATALASGFAEPVHDSQAVFRSVMMAMARPGSVRALGSLPDAPNGLDPALAAVALALCDFETPLWLAPSLAADEAVKAYLRFHTGAPLVADPARAYVALLAGAMELPDLAAFAQGEPAYPDRSTTILVGVEDLAEGEGWRLAGPGIAGTARLRAAPLPSDMPAQLAANAKRFPLGVDLVFVAGGRVAALPRTTLVEA